MARTRPGCRIQILGRTPCNISRRNRIARYQTNPRITHPNHGQKHAYTYSTRYLHTRRDDFDEPLPHPYQREEDEDEAFDEDGSECEPVGDGSSSVISNDLVCEVGVEAHAGSE